MVHYEHTLSKTLRKENIHTLNHTRNLELRVVGVPNLSLKIWSPVRFVEKQKRFGVKGAGRQDCSQV